MTTQPKPKYETWPSLDPMFEDVRLFDNQILHERKSKRVNLKRIEALERDMAIAASLAPQAEEPQ